MTHLAGTLLGASGGFHLPRVEYSQMLPELILLGSAIALVAGVSLSRSRPRPGFYAGFTAGAALAALGAACWLWQDLGGRRGHTAVAGAIAVDGFSVFFLVLISVALLLAVLVADAFLRREDMDGPEFYALAMLSSAGAMFMAAANDLIMVFLGLEILSIALYVLAGLNGRRSESGEAAMKYFVLGAFSSAIFLYGIALTYGATGTTNIPQIADFLARNVIVSNGVLLGGLALLLVGFCFKIAAVPFHTWTPDVYQGSPTPVTGFMAAVAKAAGFAGLLRVFFSSFSVLRLDWEPLIWVISVLTLLVGAVLAVVQRDIKRMLAYSSINHAGFVLIGLQAATAVGIAGSLYYLFAYAFMVIGSFAVVTVVGGRGDDGHDLESYRGLATRNPFLALAFTVLLVAQAGIPFTTGFLAKFYVVSAAVDSRSYALAVIAMASAVVAAFFYLRVIILMFSSPAPVGVPETTGGLVGSRLEEAAGAPGRVGPEPAAATVAAPTATAAVTVAGRSAPTAARRAPTVVGPRRIQVPIGVAITLVLTVGFTVVFGLWPSPIFDFAHRATLLF